MPGDILHPPVGLQHCTGFFLAPTESPQGPMSRTGSSEVQTWISLPPPPTPTSASVWMNNYLEIIFLGLKNGWEQMGYELGIWGWGKVPAPLPPHPGPLKGPLRCGEPVTGQEESVGKTNDGSGRRKGRGGLRPSGQGKRALPDSTTSFLRSQYP